MPRVLVLGTIHASGLARLRERPELEIIVLEERDEAGIDAALPTADAVLVRTAPLPAARLARAPRLRVIAKHGVGVDNIDLAEASRRRIPVAITANANATAVAEFAFAQMLNLAKELRALDEAVRAGDWAVRHRLAALELAQKTLLVIGFGRIGSRLARRAIAFEMKVLAFDPFIPAETIRAADCTPVEDLDVALGEADVVSLHCPLTDKTRGLLNAARLARLKPTAILINTARGGIVDETALAEALRARRLAAAALDVFACEPLPASHPLLKVPGLVLSPHMAGITQESAQRMALEAAANLLAGLDGRLDPALVVNPEVLA